MNLRGEATKVLKTAKEIDWAEKRGCGIGGGFCVSSEDFEGFEISAWGIMR